MVAALFEVFLGAAGAVGGLLRFIGEIHLSTSTFIYLIKLQEFIHIKRLG